MSTSRITRAEKEALMSKPSSERPAKPSSSKDRSVLFCEQCYRYDKHIPVRVSFGLKVVLIVATFGLALVFWPKRCSCCGSMRF